MASVFNALWLGLWVSSLFCYGRRFWRFFLYFFFSFVSLSLRESQNVSLAWGAGGGVG